MFKSSPSNFLMYFATNNFISIPIRHSSCISHLILLAPLKNYMVCILVCYVLFLQKGTMFLLCKHESFNVQKSWQLCSFLPKPIEPVQHNARLVGGTSGAKVKESNNFMGIMEEVSTETNADDDYMLGELVSIINFNFVIYFCSICFLCS
jgi:hypothetical protein